MEMDSIVPPETPSPDPFITENSDLGSETLAQTEGIAEANSRFTTGDFVWAKVTGHPWWPALVSSQTKKDSVLVVCFGDGDASAWCEPKHLKPFLKLFDEMSRQSSSKSFLRALGSCLEEVRKNLELEMTCRCVPSEARSIPLRGEGSRELLLSNFSPKEFQEHIMDAARNVNAVNALDATRLKSWVLALGKVLMQGDSWVFHRRRGIEDLVDKIDLDALPVEMVSSKEEEEVIIDVSIGKRRRRSMSKLLADMDLDFSEVGDDEKDEQSSRSKRRKSKGKVEDVKAEEEHDSSSGRRERKKSKYLSPPYTNLREVGKFLAMLPRKGSSISEHGTTISSAYNGEEDDNNSNLQKIENMLASELFSEFLSTAENPLHLKGNRVGKVVKYFFSFYRDSKYSDGADFEDYQNLVHESIPNTEDSVEDSGKRASRISKGEGNKETDLDVKQKKANSKLGADQERKLNLEQPKRSRKDKDQLDTKLLNSGRLEKQKPRRKTLSKDGTSQEAPIYLDFCNANASGGEKEKRKSRSSMDETRDGGQFENASLTVKEKKRMRRKKMLNDGTRKGTPANLDLNTTDSLGEFKCRQGKKRSKNDVNGESPDLVDLQSIDDSEDGVSLAIEPINSQEQVVVNDKKVGNKEDANGKSLQKSCYADARFAELAKSVLKKKNSSGHSKAKPGKKKVKGVDPVYERHAALHLIFHSGVELPCVEDLITTYSKYGDLIHNRIELFEESNSARVVFANAMDAEIAFKDKAGPYGSVATYRLHYLSENLVDPSEPNHDDVSPSLQIYDVISPLQQADLKSLVHKPPLPYIRKSLATMISSLALSSSSLINNAGLTSDGLKPEARENLVGEMQGLLQKVDKMLNGGGSST